MKESNPIIIKIPDNKKSLESLYNSFSVNNVRDELVKNYPIVYIHNWKKGDKYEVYVGESSNFYQRTNQHFDQINNLKSWQKNLKKSDAMLYVIAHPKFNKSLTLDIENKIMHYLSSSSSVNKVHNAKGNPQNKYYSCEDFDQIFSKIWRKLRKDNDELFLLESEIKDSAIYKASPLHKLNLKQKLAKEKILDKVLCLMQDDNKHEFIWVQGDAGTGKTVLMSSLFYELINYNKKEVEEFGIKRTIETAIIVNNKEQLTVYEEITKKLDLVSDNKKMFFNPTQFINQFIDKKIRLEREENCMMLYL